MLGWWWNGEDMCVVNVQSSPTFSQISPSSSSSVGLMYPSSPPSSSHFPSLQSPTRWAREESSPREGDFSSSRPRVRESGRGEGRQDDNWSKGREGHATLNSYYIC